MRRLSIRVFHHGSLKSAAESSPSRAEQAVHATAITPDYQYQTHLEDHFYEKEPSFDLANFAQPPFQRPDELPRSLFGRAFVIVFASSE